MAEGFDRFGEDGFWSTEIGVVLLVKFVLVGLMLVISGYHDFVFGPKISELMRLVPCGEHPPDSTVAARRRLIVLARLNLSIAITVVVLGPMLVRGVPG
jgi:putative copper export protein